MEKAGKPLNDHSMVVCEKFTVEYIANSEGVSIPTQELYLVEPSEEYEGEIKSYREELLASKEEFDGARSLLRLENPKDWVALCRERSNPNGPLKAGEVRSTTLLCIRKSDRKLVGMIQIRHELNDFLRQYAGHLGYSVRTSERKKGYATWMVAHIIDYTKTLGIEKLYVSCVKENEASRKTILANGGTYLETIHEPKEDVDLERYVLK